MCLPQSAAAALCSYSIVSTQYTALSRTQNKGWDFNTNNKVFSLQELETIGRYRQNRHGCLPCLTVRLMLARLWTCLLVAVLTKTVGGNLLLACRTCHVVLRRPCMLANNRGSRGGMPALCLGIGRPYIAPCACNVSARLVRYPAQVLKRYTSSRTSFVCRPENA